MRLSILALALAVILSGGHGTPQEDGVLPSAAEFQQLRSFSKRMKESSVFADHERPHRYWAVHDQGRPQKRGLAKNVPGHRRDSSGRPHPKAQASRQDEILLIQTGSAHVWLGAQERNVHAEAVVSFLLIPGSV